MSAEDRLKELGFELPPAPKAVGVYKPVMTVGNLVYTSGHLPMMPDGSLLTGLAWSTAPMTSLNNLLLSMDAAN
jgi:enamine deaminase RidA (YjgF/YER057c/UK114 family)